MFQTMKQLFAPTNKDLRLRILFTLGALMIFVIGTGVQVPGTADVTVNLGFLELINVMGGGALKQFSIFGLGVMPYITASIIVQLLQMDIFPYFSELKDEGPVGRQKLNQITRYMGIIFAFIEGFAFAYAFLGSGKTTMDYMYVATILTAGTAFLLWLGDQVTQKGIGNGISLIILAGIVATMPSMFITAFKELITKGEFALWLGILLFVLFVIVYFLIIVGVIFVELAERKIPIQYANKSTSAYGNQSFMPIKVNTAGVMPVIFASSLLAIPATIAQLVKNEKFINFVNNYLTYTKPVGFIIFVALIFFFAYFYTYIQLKPEDLAKNLKENGGFIPGVRPGKDTEKYISNVLSKLTIIGGVFLVIIAGLPIIFSSLSGLSSTVTIGGTSLLIVVGVALETYKQLEGSLVSRNYKKGYSRR
ncbi:MAG: preprotein translocase subunit SecY [Bacilli bacterium]|nr:preprotein translocase subunit SecY [Clostridium sp.]MDY6015861.1 preprotein translocase subunit SecY [Bacilli bacterium]